MMVPQLISIFRSHPRARARARFLALAPCAAIECLEERTLLSASLALFNGNYAGSYKGTVVVNNKGTITTSAVTATAFQSTFTNGVIATTTPAGAGTGSVNSNGAIAGTVNSQTNGVNFPITFSGNITAVNSSGTAAAGGWSYSVNLGNGVTVTGNGTWTASAAPVVSDFNGNYAGNYAGTVVTNNNGTTTNSAVNTTAFTAVINNGSINVTFPSPTGLTAGPATINVNGNITGTASFVDDGVTVTVNYMGSATRSLSGVNASGTWTFTANLGNGVTQSGTGTWTTQSVLVADGTYTGSFNGSTVLDNNGVITTTPIPSEVSNLSVSLTISNGTVTLSAPGVPATGTGTIDQNGNITGTTSFMIDGVAVTGQFTGTVVLTPNGNVITGAWTFSVNLGSGIVETGSGTWTAES
jgi:hypothetical protein